MTSRKDSVPHRWSELAITMRDRQHAMAQDAAAPPAATQLPEITVTAPSPIRAAPTSFRRERQRASPAPHPAAIASARPQPQPVAGRAAPQQGVLPVVTDQFATVTVVPNEEIRRSGGATLGDLLFSKPGITGSSFAPGASSRPIIRGLDVNRVGIVENGIGGGGASDLGEDHFVPIDPLATNQVEVMRGPAALRYGSTSIGGVVSATNNRIPDALPTCPAAPFKSLRTAGEGAAGRCAIVSLHECRDANGGEFGRPRRRRRHLARCRRQQCRGSCRRLRPQGQRLQHPELSLSVRPRRTSRSTAGSRTPRRRRMARRSAAPTSSRAASSARPSRRTTRSIAFPASTAPITRPGSTRHQTKFTAKGEYRPACGRDRCGQVLGRRHRLSAQRDRPCRSRPIPRPSASGRPSPTRSRKAASRCR